MQIDFWIFNLYFLCLVGSIAGFVVGSDLVSCIRISPKFFIWNNMLLKLLRTVSLSLNTNPKLFEKTIFQLCFYLYLHF